VEGRRTRKSGVQTRGIRFTIGRALHRSEVLGTGAVSFGEKLTGLAGRNWFPGNWIRITAASSTTSEQTAVQVGDRNPLRLLYFCSAYQLISVLVLT